jgi:DNA-damage-inducible protein J
MLGGIMLKTAIVRARIEPRMKDAVEKILDKLGLSTSEAINIFLKQIYLKKGLPFEIKLPNDELREAVEGSRKGKNISRYKTADELFMDLKI